ncbi:unnamed protein product [Lymnaea stagnalis]|uniref:G-protein coupled receptors family 3 profile domain-containing protein n=1 Tax=Lymnaea stagnalis TaxID=6523 RepID=A0AAV2HLB9_LYMST
MYGGIQVLLWAAILVLSTHADATVNKTTQTIQGHRSLFSHVSGVKHVQSRRKLPDLEQKEGSRVRRAVNANEGVEAGENNTKTRLNANYEFPHVQTPGDNPLGTTQQTSTDKIHNSVAETAARKNFVLSGAVSGSRSRKTRNAIGKNDTGSATVKGNAAAAAETSWKKPAMSSSNTRARREGDAIIGALFPLHEAPTQETAYTRQCGKIREHYGIQRVETMLMTIEKINNDPSILPNITLGWDIRDSCWYSAIALENSIDFIKDAIASQSKRENELMGMELSLKSPASAANDSSKRCKSDNNLKPIVGLVGPGSSESTIQVQNLLQIFNIPQIGYSATAMDLSDKSHFKYFLRVVPPDLFQAQALLDIVVYFNWTYISTIHSDGIYGVRGMEKFKDIAKDHGVCIAQSENVASSADDASYDRVLDSLRKSSNASVVVCFCEGKTVRNLLLATKRKGLEGQFLIIGSDGWGNRLDVIENIEATAVGGISMVLYSPRLTDFDSHYAKLTPHNPKNPWFREFWEAKFNCSLSENGNTAKYTRRCREITRGVALDETINHRDESLAGSEPDSKLGFVANAVTTMARALHNMHLDLCPGSPGLCPAMEPVNGSLYLQYLLNVSFQSYSDQEVRFDSKGDPPGRYEIVNYQPVLNKSGHVVSYHYTVIGKWMDGVLTLNESKIYWPRYGNMTRQKMTSVCSQPCPPGQAKKVNGLGCCWICQQCQEDEILVDNNTNCRVCDLGLWPDLNKTGKNSCPMSFISDCEEIPIDFISWRETEAIVCITLACVGICVTLWIFVIFIRYHDTPIVKASTRELSYIILVGICLAFSANFFIVAKPAKEFCYLTRILPGLSFSLMYGALVTRTNRIARILEGSKRIMTKKPKFMSATAQVVITGIIIGIECAVITGMLVYQPADFKMDYPAPRKVRLVCDTSTLGIVVPLGFDLVLILLCTIYAVKTRNLPENFNEAKFIGFTMYSTCVIWLGFFPIYFAGQNKEMTLSISVSLSAAIALLLLFMPKVYVIVWVPEKNTRGAFTTSRDVRCHIGSKSMASADSVDIKESSTFENLFKSDKGHSRNWKQKSLDEKRLRFVMQRSGAADGETPYVNHGVLPNHAVRSAAFVNRDNSSDSTRTESTPVSSLSCPEKERLFVKDHREAAGVEAIRQNLARDFPMQNNKRQLSLRPGSPAEKEKHRVHNLDPLDLDELLGDGASTTNTRLIKPRDFRKSLSSTCVSVCPKTKSVECQTSEDLVQCLLPPLRKRCVSKNKNKLERSGAVDDNIATGVAHEIHLFRFPSPVYPKPLTIQRTTLPSPHSQDNHYNPSSSSPCVVCHGYDRKGQCSLPDLDIPESSLLLGDSSDPHRRRSHQQMAEHQHPNRDHRSNNRRRSNGHSSFHTTSPFLATPHTRSPHSSTSRLLTPESPDFSFLEGVEEFENSISTAYSDHRVSPLKMKTRTLPEPGVSPSSRHRESDMGCYYKNPHNASQSSLAADDSSSSATVSTASSSFTLPPFQTSTDSNVSDHTLGDSDNLEMDDKSPPQANRGLEEDEEDDEELVSINKNAARPLMGDKSVKSNGLTQESPLIPLEALEREEREVLEFHRYLQGHGVKLDLSTVQSSDL